MFGVITQSFFRDRPPVARGSNTPPTSEARVADSCVLDGSCRIILLEYLRSLRRKGVAHRSHAPQLVLDSSSLVYWRHHIQPSDVG